MNSVVATGKNLERILEVEQRLAALQPGTDAYRRELRTILGIQDGRPPKRPPPDAARLIEERAAEGCTTIKEMAASFKVAVEVFRRWLLESEELQLAFAIGRERERDELHRILVRDARDGEKPNINAMFLLKSRHGYREGEALDSGVPRISVTFNLPGAMAREDFMKTVVSER